MPEGEVPAVAPGSEVPRPVKYVPTDVEVYDHLFTELEEAAGFNDDARRELLRIANEYRLLAQLRQPVEGREGRPSLIT